MKKIIGTIACFVVATTILSGCTSTEETELRAMIEPFAKAYSEKQLNQIFPHVSGKELQKLTLMKDVIASASDVVNVNLITIQSVDLYDTKTAKVNVYVHDQVNLKSLGVKERKRHLLFDCYYINNKWMVYNIDEMFDETAPQQTN